MMQPGKGGDVLCIASVLRDDGIAFVYQGFQAVRLVQLFLTRGQFSDRLAFVSMAPGFYEKAPYRNVNKISH